MTPLDNIFPNETQPRPIMSHHKNHYWHNAEETNGRLAMIGFVAAIGSYIFTGNIIPGIF